MGWYRRKHALILIAAGVLIPPPTAGAQSPSAVVMANTCFSCHGTDGRSAGAMPSIAGKSPGYIASVLKDFRSDKRPSTVMNRIAKGFTDSEIDSLATYFSRK